MMAPWKLEGPPPQKETARALGEEHQAADQTKQQHGNSSTGLEDAVASLNRQLTSVRARACPMGDGGLLVVDPLGACRAVPDIRSARLLARSWGCFA